RRALVATIVAGLTLSLLTPANGVVSRNDGDDTRGALDLRRVTATYKDGYATFKVETHDAFRADDIEPDNGWIEIDLDTNDDQRWNYYLIGYFDQRYRGVVLRRSGDLLSRGVSVSHPSAKVLLIRVRTSIFTSAGSYDFAAFGVTFARPCSDRSPCVDGVPNRFPLLRHDWTQPTVNFGPLPTYSVQDGPGLSVDFHFGAKDNQYGTGVRRWAVQTRPVGGSWTDTQTGRAIPPSVVLSGEEGAHYEIRIKATDGQDNTTVSETKHAIFPYDDANAALAYTGDWSIEANAEAYLGSRHVGQPGSTVTFDVAEADVVCFVVGPSTGDAVADVDFGGPTYLSGMGVNTPPRTTACETPGITGPFTITITVGNGAPYVLDGIVATTF
ncbi:MAG TPA: hypothetical protein VF235_07360, partial [Actinomycetota bacterium]